MQKFKLVIMRLSQKRQFLERSVTLGLVTEATLPVKGDFKFEIYIEQFSISYIFF